MRNCVKSNKNLGNQFSGGQFSWGGIFPVKIQELGIVKLNRGNESNGNDIIHKNSSQWEWLTEI